MNHIDDKEKLKLIKIFGDISHNILTRSHPFDKIPVQKEATSFFYLKYLDYYNELDPLLRENILEYQLDYANYLIFDHFIGSHISFFLQYPKHVLTKEVFSEWLSEKEGSRVLRANIPTNRQSINIGQIIKAIMKQRKPDFSFDKSIIYPGMLSFSNSALTKEKITIGIEKGTKRQFLSLILGIKDGRYLIDIANLFAQSQSCYEYNSTTDASQMVNKGIDLVESILPHFISKLNSTAHEP